MHTGLHISTFIKKPSGKRVAHLKPFHLFDFLGGFLSPVGLLRTFLREETAEVVGWGLVFEEGATVDFFLKPRPGPGYCALSATCTKMKGWCAELPRNVIAGSRPVYVALRVLSL